MCLQFSTHPFWYQAFAPSVEPVFRSSKRFAPGISGFRCRWRWFWNMSLFCSARALFQALQQRRFTKFWMRSASWRSITRCFLHGDHSLKTPTMTLFWNSRSRLRPPILSLTIFLTSSEIGVSVHFLSFFLKPIDGNLIGKSGSVCIFFHFS